MYTISTVHVTISVNASLNRGKNDKQLKRFITRIKKELQTNERKSHNLNGVLLRFTKIFYFGFTLQPRETQLFIFEQTITE